MVICLERGADLHMFQLMPLPLTVSCFNKIQIGFTLLVPAHPGIVPEKRPLNGCVCVCPSPTHSFIQGLKPSFSANLSHRSPSCLFFRIHYIDSPDCLLLFLSISVFNF